MHLQVTAPMLASLTRGRGVDAACEERELKAATRMSDTDRMVVLQLMIYQREHRPGLTYGKIMLHSGRSGASISEK